jgi:hypothetical protein
MEVLMTHYRNLLAAAAIVAAGIGASSAAQSQIHFGLGFGMPYYGSSYYYGSPYYSPYSTWGGMYGTTWPGYYYGYGNLGYRYWD